MTTLQVSEDVDQTKTKRIYYCYYIFYKSSKFFYSIVIYNNMLNATLKFTIVEEDEYTIDYDYYTESRVSDGEG